MSLLKKTIRYLRNGLIFILSNDNFSFLEKLKVIEIDSTKRDSNVRNLALKRLSREEKNDNFFLIDGYKIYFQPDFAILNEAYFLEAITQVLKETFFFPVFFNSKVRIKKDDVVLDLGASIGTTALLFSELAGSNGKVFAFEPVTYSVIFKNLEKNNIKNVEVITKAVALENKKVEIDISDFCLDSSICKRPYAKNYYKNRIMAESISLDSFIDEAGLDRVDFIKVDIEGAEELAIRGSEKLIKKYRPKWSISSYHIDSNNEPQHSKLVKLLRGYGYNIEEEKGFHIYAW